MSAFSQRLAWEQPENALARAVAARRLAGLPLLDLTETNPTQVALAYDEQAIAGALADPHGLLYSPSPRGLPAARAAVARYYADAHGAAVDPERVLLTASTSEAYALLFKLLCDPGDAVLAPEPSYPLFGYLTALEGVRLAPYPLRYDGEWHLDLPALAAALEATPRVRALLVVSPGNPTGAFLKLHELTALTDLCARHGCALISDEVFADYATQDPLRREVHATAHSPQPTARVSTLAAHGVPGFALSGLSKVCGLPQLKLGWCVACGPRDFAEGALARLELIADTYLSVAAPVQHAAPALLATRAGFQLQLRARLAANRAALLAARPPDAAWDVLASEGGWSAIAAVPRARSDEEWALALLDRGVLVHPGYFFDLPRGHLVVSLLCEARVFAEGAGVLAEVLAGR